MLLGQQRGRHQHRDLFIVFHGQEGGAHRHFGFAEANVTAHQAIHRQRLTHIAEYGVNGLGLIRRGFKREAVTEQLILFFIVLKGVARFRRALGINIQQLGGDITHFFSGFLARARPGITAQFMQRGALFRATGVAADQMQRRHRYVEFCVTEIGNYQVFRRNAARFEGGHSRISPNAMFQMDNGLADVQFCQVTDQRIRVNSPTIVLTTSCHTFAEQIAFANQRPVIQGIDKSVFG
ncbi:hypothetical protein D3C72_651390 [compost metagenome]